MQDLWFWVWFCGILKPAIQICAGCDAVAAAARRLVTRTAPPSSRALLEELEQLLVDDVAESRLRRALESEGVR